MSYKAYALRPIQLHTTGTFRNLVSLGITDRHTVKVPNSNWAMHTGRRQLAEQLKTSSFHDRGAYVSLDTYINDLSNYSLSFYRLEYRTQNIRRTPALCSCIKKSQLHLQTTTKKIVWQSHLAIYCH